MPRAEGSWGDRGGRTCRLRLLCPHTRGNIYMTRNTSCGLILFAWCLGDGSKENDALYALDARTCVCRHVFMLRRTKQDCDTAFLSAYIL